MNLRISLAQLNLLVGDIEGNATRIIEAARHARDEQGAQLVIFPELTLTGYPPEDLLLRREFIERVEHHLDQLCKNLRGIDVLLGYPRLKDGAIFNAAGVIRDGEIVVEYHKNLLPNYSVFDEKRYFEPGEIPCLFEVAGRQLGITICEDIWYREPAAAAKKAGAELLLNLNASPFHTGKAPEREMLLQKRAREIDLPVVYLNLVGGQDELVFDGGSFTMNTKGEVVQRSDFFTESISVVEFESVAGQLQPAAACVQPRPEGDAAIYQALVLGVRDYARKNGFQGAVLGLSGGIDSALTLAVAVDALGADQVEVVMMPSRYTADMSNHDAIKQAENQQVDYSVIPIEPAFNSFLDMLAGEFKGTTVDTTEENIQARCRGVILMAISNKKGKILLTTGNKSEMSVGYATLYGDMAGGFAPLKDLPKMQVYALANYVNRESEIIPQRVIDRPPSAELAPDQIDSDSLPDYEILDQILERYIDLDQSVSDIAAAGFDQDEVRRVARMVDINEYKRRQAPPGVKITRRAFGRDRRYPLTSGFRSVL